MAHKVDYTRLFSKLGYTLTDKKLLEKSLTHRSYSSENYERMEFLGDAILSCVMAEALYFHFPDKSEGDLSKLRAFLVQGETLAAMANEINLGDYLFLGPGELRSGGHRRSSILSDALEAIFAAIYLDGGMEKVKNSILKLYTSRLQDPELVECIKDPKTQLQELMQAQKLALPIYTLEEITGTTHDQVFHVLCFLPHQKLEAKAQGPTRRKAEQRAARMLLKKLG